MGRIGAATQVVATRVEQQGNVVPAVDNLIVVTPGNDGSILFEGFAGEADRQIRSPYVLADSSSSDVTGLQLERFLPDRLALGDFDGDGRADAASLGGDVGKHRLWLVPITGDSSFQTAMATDSDLLPTDADFERALVGVNDLDGDGVDELVLFAPNASGPGKGAAYVARATKNSAGLRQWVVDPPAVEAASFEHAEALDGVTGAPLQRGDMDGDGRPDLVVPSAAGPDQRLLLFRNDGSGRLAAPTDVEGSNGSTAFTLLDANTHEGKEIVVTGGDDVFLLGRDHGGAFARSAAPVASLAGARLVAAGDFNGDGLDDLVLASDQTLTLFTGVPVLP
jgi:hypothetical protein